MCGDRDGNYLIASRFDMDIGYGGLWVMWHGRVYYLSVYTMSILLLYLNHSVLW